MVPRDLNTLQFLWKTFIIIIVIIKQVFFSSYTAKMYNFYVIKCNFYCAYYNVLHTAASCFPSFSCADTENNFATENNIILYSRTNHTCIIH
jgi:hypothetical protein